MDVLLFNTEYINRRLGGFCVLVNESLIAKAVLMCCSVGLLKCQGVKVERLGLTNIH